MDANLNNETCIQEMESLIGEGKGYQDQLIKDINNAKADNDFFSILSLKFALIMINHQCDAMAEVVEVIKYNNH